MKRNRKIGQRRKDRKERAKGLEAIDQALLAGEAHEENDDEQELASLALLLRDHQHQEREAPTDEFRQKMEALAEGGLKESDKSEGEQQGPGVVGRFLRAGGSLLDGFWARRGLALGGAATVLIALAVTVAVLQDGDGNGTVGPVSDSSVKKKSGPEQSLGRSSGEGKSEFAPGETDDSARLIAPEPPVPDTDIAPGEGQRRVERSAELTLEVEKNRIEDVANDVIRVSDRNRGIVISSNISTGKDKAGEATFDLRVPQEKLPKVLRELSELGDVVVRTQSGLDITQSFVTTRERLQDARAERKSLLKQLPNALTLEKAEEIKRRLRSVTSRVGSLKSQLRTLRNRTDYVRIDVTLQAGNGGSGTKDAFSDSLDFVVGVLNFGIRVFSVLLVFGIIIAAIVVPARWVRNRRRDKALE